MQRRDAVRLDRRPVLGGRVADVGLEVPSRMALRRALHVPVARDLGEHRGRRYGSAAAVPVHHRALLVRQLATPKAVHQADGSLAGHSHEGGAQRLEVRFVQPEAVDPPHAAADHGGLGGRPQHQRVQLLAARLGVLLGVVEAGEGAAVAQREALEVEQHGRRHQGPGQGTAARLVRAGHEPRSQLAVEGKQLAATWGGTAAPGRPLGGVSRGHRGRWYGGARRPEAKSAAASPLVAAS